MNVDASIIAVRENLRALATYVLKNAKASARDIVSAPSEIDITRRENMAIEIANELDALGETSIARPITERELEAVLTRLRSINHLTVPEDWVTAVVHAIRSDPR